MTDDSADVSDQTPVTDNPADISDQAPVADDSADISDQTSVTDDPADISDETSAEPEDWAEGDDLPVVQVRELFIVLGKALRAFQLYDENNPVRRRFVNSLREAFEQLWQELEGINLSVEEHRLLMAGAAIYENSSRAESLAFLLYKDGVRDLTFLPGIEGDELDKILGVLQRARMLKTAEADDLLTMLWEADLEFFKCQYVAQFTEGAVIPMAQAAEERADLGQVLQGEMEAAEEEASKEGDAVAEGNAAPSGSPPPNGDRTMSGRRS